MSPFLITSGIILLIAIIVVMLTSCETAENQPNPKTRFGSCYS